MCTCSYASEKCYEYNAFGGFFMKLGVIDVGGGLRGAFGAGVFDYCLEENINFDYAIGVSAGSANVASYMAKQKGRNFVFYTEYLPRWEYMSVKNLVKTGSYIGLDYIYSALSDQGGDYPLDWNAIQQDEREMVVVSTDAITGKAHYFCKNDMHQDQYDPIKASCCVPVVNRPYYVEGIPYYDGGLSDPVPYQKAFVDGCDKVVLILTRPIEFRRVPKNDMIIARLLSHKYPKAAEGMANRAHVYNACVDMCEKLEEQGRVCIIAPDSIGKMKTLTKDKESIEDLYFKGYQNAKKIKKFIE